MSRPRPWRLVPLLFVFLVALSGCGGDEEAPPEESAPASAQLNDVSRAIEMLMDGEAEGKELVSSSTGLQYVDLVVGEGASPLPGQICVTHATGWFLDGKKFWSSHDPEEDGVVRTFEFAISRDRVIPGFEQGVAGMKPGGKRRLAIPPELGYGEKGSQSSDIPGGAMLIYEVELLEVKN